MIVNGEEVHDFEQKVKELDFAIFNISMDLGLLGYAIGFVNGGIGIGIGCMTAAVCELIGIPKLVSYPLIALAAGSTYILFKPLVAKILALYQKIHFTLTSIAEPVTELKEEMSKEKEDENASI